MCFVPCFHLWVVIDTFPLSEILSQDAWNGTSCKSVPSNSPHFMCSHFDMIFVRYHWILSCFIFSTEVHNYLLSEDLTNALKSYSCRVGRLSIHRLVFVHGQRLSKLTDSSSSLLLQGYHEFSSGTPFPS